MACGGFKNIESILDTFKKTYDKYNDWLTHVGSSFPEKLDSIVSLTEEEEFITKFVEKTKEVSTASKKNYAAVGNLSELRSVYEKIKNKYNTVNLNKLLERCETLGENIRVKTDSFGLNTFRDTSESVKKMKDFFQEEFLNTSKNIIKFCKIFSSIITAICYYHYEVFDNTFSSTQTHRDLLDELKKKYEKDYSANTIKDATNIAFREIFSR